MSKAAPPTLSASGSARRARASRLGSLAARSCCAERGVRRESGRRRGARKTRRRTRRARGCPARWSSTRRCAASCTCTTRSTSRGRTSSRSRRRAQQARPAAAGGWPARLRRGACAHRLRDRCLGAGGDGADGAARRHRATERGMLVGARGVCVCVCVLKSRGARSAPRTKNCHQPWAHSCPTIHINFM